MAARLGGSLRYPLRSTNEFETKFKTDVPRREWTALGSEDVN